MILRMIRDNGIDVDDDKRWAYDSISINDI